MSSKKSKTEYPKPEPGETCKQYVARVSPTNYYLVNPWVDNLVGWTEAMEVVDPFPREGDNSVCHMDMVKGPCLGDTAAWPYFEPDPSWDMDYMQKGGEQWLEIAPHWYDPNM